MSFNSFFTSAEYMNRNTGATKEQTGKALGNQESETEGRNQKGQATGEQQVNSAKDAMRHASDQITSITDEVSDLAKNFDGGSKECSGVSIVDQLAANKSRRGQAEAAVKEAARGQQYDL